MSAPVRSHAPGCPCQVCSPCSCDACAAFEAAWREHMAVIRSGAPRDLTRDVLCIAAALVERRHPGKTYPDREYTKAKEN